VDFAGHTGMKENPATMPTVAAINFAMFTSRKYPSGKPVDAGEPD